MSKDIREILQRQLPIIDAVNVESTWYALRMTPLGKYTSSDLEEFIKSLTNTYVFIQEISKQAKEHYHCVINIEVIDEFELRECIRKFLRKHFGIPKRGDANKQYNLSECIDVETSIIYLLKDGGLLWSSNFYPDKLGGLRRKSYKKYDKEDFALELKEIKDKVKDMPSLRLDDIMNMLVKLKTVYRQPVNMSYIYQLSLTMYLHNHPDLIVDYVQKFLSRLE